IHVWRGDRRAARYGDRCFALPLLTCLQPLRMAGEEGGRLCVPLAACVHADCLALRDAVAPMRRPRLEEEAVATASSRGAVRRCCRAAPTGGERRPTDLLGGCQ
ncbi:hypothetical protein Dimus_000504, partial [Dionaea muscipula]